MGELYVHNKKIHFKIHGEKGDPLVLLNGLMMTTNSWLPLMPTLKENFRVICVDLHDMGQSEKMDGLYKHDVQVEVVKELLIHLDISKAHLCGTSYGGTIALQFGLTYPKFCDKIMVFNTLPYADKFLTDIGENWKKAALSYDCDKFYDELAPLVYAPWFYEKHHKSIYDRKDMLRPIMTKEYMDSIARLSDSTVGYDIRDRLHEMKIPILVVGSDEDYLTPLKQQYFLKDNLPNCEFILVPDSGHGAVYEKSKLIVMLMIGWFRELVTIDVFK